ncbi:unnamed protein product [Microthlaspi erraticum]|uniref:Uncharacterized protein n=1 Tax=Microthlaspi erraticum TaxID=1685480 RepID=A0A6D2IY27_9BRAS|nr:unnamed protein product [Microthlaspi erraticum]
MQAPTVEQTSVLQVKTGHQGWQKKLTRIFEDIGEPFRAFRKPKTTLRCIFEQNALDESWYKRVIGALKTFQVSDVSLTIDTPAQKGNEMEYHQKGYLCGNIKFGMFIKMLGKTGIKVSGCEYGFASSVYNIPHLKPPPPMYESWNRDTVPPFIVHS